MLGFAINTMIGTWKPSEFHSHPIGISVKAQKKVVGMAL
jgi:hypothetical protein